MVMVNSVESSRSRDRGVQAEVRHRGVPAGARRSVRLHLQEGDPGEGSDLVREEHPGVGPVSSSSLYETGQSIKGVRNPDYYHEGQPYLDGFIAIFAAKQSVRVDAIRADRAATEFRGMPPSARDELVKELGDKVTVQTSDWNCVNLLTPNQKKKPFDDVRVRRAMALAIDPWKGAPALSKIATVHTVGGLVFPGSPLLCARHCPGRPAQFQRPSRPWLPADGGRVVRHDDDGFCFQCPRGIRDPLGVVAAGIGNYAALAFVFGQGSDLVVGSAQFERADGLLVFRLQQKPSRVFGA